MIGIVKNISVRQKEEKQKAQLFPLAKEREEKNDKVWNTEGE